MFVLSQIFSFPIILVEQEAYVGGQTLSRKQGNFLDYLVKNRLTENLSSLVEIKTPATRLLGQRYRPDIFSPSPDLAGAVQQIINNRENLLKDFYGLKVRSGEDIERILAACARNRRSHERTGRGGPEEVIRVVSEWPEERAGHHIRRDVRQDQHPHHPARRAGGGNVQVRRRRSSPTRDPATDCRVRSTETVIGSMTGHEQPGRKRVPAPERRHRTDQLSANRSPRTTGCFSTRKCSSKLRQLQACPPNRAAQQCCSTSVGVGPGKTAISTYLHHSNKTVDAGPPRTLLLVGGAEIKAEETRRPTTEAVPITGFPASRGRSSTKPCRKWIALQHITANRFPDELKHEAGVHLRPRFRHADPGLRGTTLHCSTQRKRQRVAQDQEEGPHGKRSGQQARRSEPVERPHPDRPPRRLVGRQ